MSQSQHSLLEVEKIFKLRPKLYAWIIHYGITHHFLRLAVHEGNYPRGARIACEDCFYISGLTQGGPYSLEVFQERDAETGEVTVVVTGNRDEFIIKCGSIHLQSIKD